MGLPENKPWLQVTAYVFGSNPEVELAQPLIQHPLKEKRMNCKQTISKTFGKKKTIH